MVRQHVHPPGERTIRWDFISAHVLAINLMFCVMFRMHVRPPCRAGTTAVATP